MFTSWKFSFEFPSFLIGFLTASLFWWLFLKAKKSFPGIKVYILKQIEIIRERNRAGINAVIRQSTLRKVQHQHFASKLFALDEIIIPPLLIVPPPDINPHISGYPDLPTFNVLPFLPDWPELAAQFPTPKISLAHAVEDHVNLVILGQPGTGKTVALAHLASQLSRRDPEVKALDPLVPIFSHIHDYDLDEINDLDPITPLVKAVSSQFSYLVSTRLHKYLSNILTEGKIILLLDGLDEISDENYKKAVVYIGMLLKKYPKAVMVTTADPSRIDGLVSLGFTPCILATWNNEQRTEFIEKWQTQWSDKILPEAIKRANYEPIDLDLIKHWLGDNFIYLSPLELTLRAWASYAGDMLGSGPVTALEAYIRRTSRGIIPREAIEGLAFEFIQRKTSALGFGTIESFLSRFVLPPESSQNEALPPVDELQQSGSQKDGRAKKGQKLSQSASVIEKLIDTGILKEYSREQIGFAHPLIQGYLAGFVNIQNIQDYLGQLTWPAQTLFAKFLAARGKLDEWINYSLKSDIYPVYHHLFTYARWLSDTPPNIPWRSQVMQYMMSLLKQEDLPVSIRARLLAAFITTNDVSISVMVKQLFTSESAVLRFLAVIGAGTLCDQKLINDLINLYTDPDESVRTAACLSIGAVNSKQSFTIMVDTLKQADENLRYAAAQTLASKPAGQDILQEAVNDEDLLTRRAAVQGLSQIRTDWSKILLEKIAIQDGQWIVRSAAGQGLEYLNSQDPFIPQVLPPPSESPWLITFASKQGIGISPGDPATEILLNALKSGANADKIYAMAYLRLLCDQEITKAIYQVLLNETGQVQEAALYSLEFIQANGVDLTSHLT